MPKISTALYLTKGTKGSAAAEASISGSLDGLQLSEQLTLIYCSLNKLSLQYIKYFFLNYAYKSL